ncbi:hypothetical protein ACT3TI_01035 [Psychrobacter sp. AOP22-C1-22]|uniref:hypothetical protein n=1 Tax=unclassified Psychrobacter TaxID=196806 RepID=UPI001787D97B|nr:MULTISPECIES: hypothetical protein [unclassified Psychrobacter]MBE0405845.1 hypothetical protein [Psychrobacter sp. FME6]MBE0444606.1 hypothetical protein [Psychrobacter sp. FME5]MDN5801590.1 hypothetical protein [Psychrobacter sp.]MDN5890718.1 hypothetical protein [Psychrobacter sp.]
MDILIIVGVVVVLAFVFIMAALLMLKAFYFKVEQGKALIINGVNKIAVRFDGGFVWPVINKKELMRISLITLEVDRRGKEGLICADNMRADITVAFYLRVNETEEDVLKVAKSLGAERASDKVAVNELFNAKFSEALKTVGKQIDFVKLFENRSEFRDSIVKEIGNDLNGYVLEDVAIDYLEQTPKVSLDSSNILDSEGIKKITQLTAFQNVMTNELERDEELAVKKKNVETVEAMLELERQQADAEAKQKREISSVIARETAETRKIEEEERKKSETAIIMVEQDLAIQRENQQREVEVAGQNRLRAVVIEEEKVTRARDLEIVSREREVDLQRIEAERAIELEKKEIANVIRERIAVDKTVAQEEERIKEVREVSEAERAKQTRVLAAEADAEEIKVRQVKKAEAEELSAKHKAVEITTLANANLEASAKDSEAKIKMAEGIKAEESAHGFAEAAIQEVKAASLEKEGLAKANIIKATGQAEAQSEREKGMADAEVIAARGASNAKAEHDIGLADAQVIAARGESNAKAEREVGLAKAEVTRAHFQAEADGLVEKFNAMGSMSKEAREHEEFRMGLETALQEAMASIDAGKEIAKENAEVLAVALQKAKIDIVGGEAHFFDNFAKSLSIGKAIDGLAGKSDTLGGIINTMMANQVMNKTNKANDESDNKPA